MGILSCAGKDAQSHKLAGHARKSRRGAKFWPVLLPKGNKGHNASVDDRHKTAINTY